MEPIHIKSWVADYRPPLTIEFSTNIPKFKNIPTDIFLENRKNQYSQEAKIIVEAMWNHLPGGLIDAIFAELSHRMASVFSVARPPIKLEEE